MINIHLYPSSFQNESRIMREARSLARLGLFDRIDLVGTGQEGLPETEEQGAGIRIVRIGQRGLQRSVARKVLDTAAWTSSVYRRYGGEALACINCHSVATLPLGAMLKHITGARLIYDPHELETEANGLHGVRKFLTKRAERALIAAADHCIFVGRAIEEWYVREYRLANTTVLYNCPARTETACTDYFRKAFPIPAETPVFLYQGLLAEGRGIRVLVDAFAPLAGRAALVIMGYGPLEDWIKMQAERHPHIRYHHAVAPDRLLDYTAAADFGLSVIEPTSVSYDYCMPNKLFEYVMAKKPVLVSPTVEQRKFVESLGVGEVARDVTPEGVRDAVLRLMLQPPGHYLAALNRARAEYCWEQQEKKLEYTYLDVLGFRQRSAMAMAGGAAES